LKKTLSLKTETCLTQKKISRMEVPSEKSQASVLVLPR